MPFGGDHADHIYVSGLGFISGRDPLHFVERDLRRSAAAVGSGLLLLLVLPVIVLWPIEIFDAVNSAMVSMLFGSDALTSVSELFRECRELVSFLLTWVIVFLMLRTMLHPPKPKAPSTIGSKRATLCALLITMGVTSLDMGGTLVLQEVMEKLHLVEMNPGGLVPSRPLALIVYLIRVILLPAVFEEVVFRGCVLQGLRRHGDSFALFFSSLGYGMIHYTLSNDLSGFMLGLVFGYFFLRTGSLKTVIVCHVLTLALPLGIGALQGLMTPALYKAVLCLVMILLAVAGLAGFVLFCRWNHNAFVLDDSQGAALPFRRKLQICLTDVPMLAAGILWLMQAVRNLQVIS